MLISDKLTNELEQLNENINLILQNKSISNIQLENFIRNLEKRRYNILNEIKLYNKTVEYELEKIETISDKYKADIKDNILKIYIPEPMPSYKNLKTHTFKNILLNLIEITKPYSNMFNDKVIIFINIFDNIKNWDVDNKFIKPIADSLVVNRVIKDDTFDKMFYVVKGEFSDNPHTEVYITNASSFIEIMQNHVS